MHTLRNIGLCSLLACTLGSLAAPADAAGPTQVVVKFGDLNLNSHDGVAALYTRLEAAARIACASQQESWSGSITLCVDYSVGQAVAQIGAPRLVALYGTRTGHFVRQHRAPGFCGRRPGAEATPQTC
jgi:UrcA family protein